MSRLWMTSSQVQSERVAELAKIWFPNHWGYVPWVHTELQGAAILKVLRLQERNDGFILFLRFAYLISGARGKYWAMQLELLCIAIVGISSCGRQKWLTAPVTTEIWGCYVVATSSPKLRHLGLSSPEPEIDHRKRVYQMHKQVCSLKGSGVCKQVLRSLLHSHRLP